MNKLTSMSLALVLGMSMIAVAQQTTNPNSDQTGNDQMSQTNANGNSNSQQKASGKVSSDGKSFVSDQDSKSWTVNNPSALKGYEGQHVMMLIHFDPDTNTIHVVSLEPQGQQSPQ